MLSKIFSKYGTIKKVKIIRNSTNESKEIGYIEFHNGNDVTQLLNGIQFDPLILNKRKLLIQAFVSKSKNKNKFYRQSN